MAEMLQPYETANYSHAREQIPVSLVYKPSKALCFCLTSCSCTQPSMAASVEPHILGRVIGDVVDMFIPDVIMSVCYGAKHVTNGCDIKPSLTLHPPKINFSGCPNGLYTLLMVDPDAPSPSEPTMREWVHWLVTDIPGGADLSKGKEIIPYASPCPLIGIHRFILVLFRQQGPMGLVDVPQSRRNFNTRLFAGHLHLGSPAAVVFFHAQKEPASRRR